MYLTKEEQAAHVVLATGDTFLVEWLESGVLTLFGMPLLGDTAALTRCHPGNVQVR